MKQPNNPNSPILTVSTLSLKRRWSVTSKILYERIVGFEYLALINSTSPLPKIKLQTAEFRSGPDSAVTEINEVNNKCAYDAQQEFSNNIEKSFGILQHSNDSNANDVNMGNDMTATQLDISNNRPKSNVPLIRRKSEIISDAAIPQRRLFPTQGVGYGDVIIASAVCYTDRMRGMETIIEIVRVGFTGSTQGPRKPLIILNGFHDIVHVSVSSLCPSGKTVVCYTEAFNRVPFPSVDTSVSGPHGGTHSVPMPSYPTEYKMILCVVNSKCKNISLDVSVLPIACGLRSYNSMYQVGYFTRKRKDSAPLYLIQCCDYNTIHIRTVNVILHNGESRKVAISKVKEQLCSKPCWHHWDPTTQRLSFYVHQMGCYKFKMVQFNGDGPSPKDCIIISKNERDTCPNMREAFQVSVPPPHIPFASGCSSLNPLLQITMLPISFESGVQDIALCCQEIQHIIPPSVKWGPYNSDGKLQRDIELNAESLQSVTNTADDVDDGKKTLKDAKVASRIDVQYRELCVTITLLHNWLVSTKLNIKLPDIPIDADITQRASFAFIEGVIAIIVPGVCVHFVDVGHHEQPPKHLFGVPIGTPANEKVRKGFSETPYEQMSPGENLLFQNQINTPIPTLPCGNGNWLFEVNGVNLLKVGISITGLWEWIKYNSTTALLEDLRGASHLTTTHFGAPMKIEHFVVSNVFDMLRAGVSPGPSLLAKSLIGECYGKVRDLAKLHNNPYWQLIPMYAGVGGFDVNSIRARKSLVKTESEIQPQKEILKRTVVFPEWWVTKPDNRENKFLELFKKKKPTPPTRPMSLASSFSLMTSNRPTDKFFRDSILEVLRSAEVPLEDASFISQLYNDIFSNMVESMLLYNEIITDPPLTPEEELQFLHNLNIALCGINYSPSREFESRYARLALRSLPIAAVHLGIQSQMYKPSFDDLFTAYSSLLGAGKKRGCNFSRTFSNFSMDCKDVTDRHSSLPSGFIRAPKCSLLTASEVYGLVKSYAVEGRTGLVDKYDEYDGVQLSSDSDSTNIQITENQRNTLVVQDFSTPQRSRHVIYDYDEIEAVLKEEGYLSSSSDNQSDDSEDSKYTQEDEDKSFVYIPTAHDHLAALTSLLVTCPKAGNPTSFLMHSAAACIRSSAVVSNTR